MPPTQQVAFKAVFRARRGDLVAAVQKGEHRAREAKRQREADAVAAEVARSKVPSEYAVFGVRDRQRFYYRAGRWRLCPPPGPASLTRRVMALSR